MLNPGRFAQQVTTRLHQAGETGKKICGAD
jgi:hypothetical protein